MDDVATLLKRYQGGGRLTFGPESALAQGALHLPGTSLPINTLQPLRLDANGSARVRRIGSDEPPLLLTPIDVDDLDLFVRVTNHLIESIPSQERRSVTGWPPGSIGDVSMRIGYDARDLLIVGYTHDQISGVLHGTYSLDELLEQEPEAAGAP